jgi:hypothetical protein
MEQKAEKPEEKFRFKTSPIANRRVKPAAGEYPVVPYLPLGRQFEGSANSGIHPKV